MSLTYSLRSRAIRYPLTLFRIAYAFSWLVWVPLALSKMVLASKAN